jgi:type III pantothenate kinase
MIMCLDVGNSQIYGGVMDENKIAFKFRRTTQVGVSSDEMGLFLKSVLRENGVDPSNILHIAICSVVPEVVHSLRGACLKYFKVPPFLLQAGTRTGLKIKYRNPLEVGADRIANAIAATHLYPDRDLLIVDFGTATTFCAVNRNKEYLGGSIIAGIKISMQALETKTSKLPSVEIVVAKEALGRSTVESIQSGLFFGQVGMVKEISQRLIDEAFKGDPPMIIGTGGFSSLFEREKLFDKILPDLVLQGLYLALKMNA